MGKAKEDTKYPAVTAVPKKKAVQQSVSADERRRRIEAAAYDLAERRAFMCGDPEQDWLQAERQVDAEITQSPM